MDETILRDVKNLLAQVLHDPGAGQRLRDEDDLVMGLGLESLQMIEFLLSVETHFEVALDFEQIDMSTLGSVRQFAALVEELLGAQGKARARG